MKPRSSSEGRPRVMGHVQEVWSGDHMKGNMPLRCRQGAPVFADVIPQISSSHPDCFGRAGRIRGAAAADRNGSEGSRGSRAGFEPEKSRQEVKKEKMEAWASAT